MKQFIQKFWNDEEGIQTLEIMLIIAVIVVIALMFRTQIIEWVERLFDIGNEKIEQFGQATRTDKFPL